MGGGQQLEGEAKGNRARLGDMYIQDLFWGLQVVGAGGSGVGDVSNSGPFLLSQYHSQSLKEK